MNIKGFINRGELAREKGQDEKALSMLDKAIFEAGKKKDYASLLSALSHKLLIWKHAYLKTKDGVFLELMRYEAMAGLDIAKAKNNKGFQAIFLLRLGHYEQYRGNYKQAVTLMSQGIKLTDRKDLAKYSEYLGHLGLSQSLAGNSDARQSRGRSPDRKRRDKKGLSTLRQSLKLIEKAKKVRPFHRLVIHSGILLRTSIALNKFGKKSETREMQDAAIELSKILTNKYKMPMRLHEALEIRNKKLRVF